MNTMAAAMLPMMVAMAAAGFCALLDSCRTAATLVCAVVMVTGMADVAYFHLFPIEPVVALVAFTGIWAGLSGRPEGGMHDAAVRTHRVVCSIAMAALMYRHADAMAMMDICTTGVDDGPINISAMSLAGTTVLLLTGALLTLRKRRSGGSHAKPLNWKLSTYEPTLMGLGLVLMAG